MANDWTNLFEELFKLMAQKIDMIDQFQRSMSCVASHCDGNECSIADAHKEAAKARAQVLFPLRQRA